jgi:hypothetical protein
LREYETDRKVGAKIPINDISEDKTENTEEGKEGKEEAKEKAKVEKVEKVEKEGKEGKAKEEAKEERTDKDKRRVPKKYTKKQKEVELNISHNGFPMYQGPGGGKYYYRDGKKVYVYSLTDTNPNVVYSVHPVRSS